MVRTQILQGSTSEHVRARFSRRPTSCAVSIFDSGGNEIVTDGEATLGPVTTIAAASGLGQADQRLIHLTSVASLEFLGFYVAINSSQQRETVQLISVPSDGACATAHPLEYAYVVGDAFESCEASYALSADETDDVGRNFRARFAAAMPGGAVEVVDTLFDVVRHRLEQPLTARNIDERSPRIRDLLVQSARGTGWATMLATAFGDLYQDLVTQGLKPDRYVDSERLAALHLYKLKIALAEEGLNVGEEEYPFQAAKHFARAYEALLADVCGKASWYDHTDDLVPTENEETPAVKGRVL